MDVLGCHLHKCICPAVHSKYGQESVLVMLAACKSCGTGNAGLTAPAPKRQHTQHVQAAGTSAPVLSGQDNESEASARVTDVVARRPPSLHSSQQAGLQAAQVTEASSRDSAAGSGRPNDRPQAAQQELDPRPAPSNAAPQQPTPSLGAMPDNNTVLWEPLVVRVTHPLVFLQIQHCISLPLDAPAAA